MKRTAAVRRIAAFLFLLIVSPAFGQEKAPDTLKGVLLAQLRSTHNKKEWFVPVSVALDGVSVEQAKWSDGKGNHSIGQLAYHLLFWNTQELAKLKGEKPAAFSGNNEETFNNFDAKAWKETVQKLDQVLSEMEKTIEGMDEAKLKSLANEIAHTGTHNAYHIGQIVVLRRQQGSWDPEKGVK
jgi:uncharacterized damage-inducible protein DinB